MVTAVLHGQSLHRSHEDWLIHQTHGLLPAPLLVLDADQDRDTMLTTFETHKVTIATPEIFFHLKTFCRMKSWV